jgi:hypothetical protein
MRKRKCNYWPGENKCFHEITVSAAEWRSLLNYSYELDVDKGSYYDGRLGAISFWCGPKDKPSDWPGRITKGALKYPREYIGAVFGDHTDSGKVRLHFKISAYERAHRKGLKMGSRQWNKEMRGTRTDRQWVLRQFKLLRQHVRLMRRGVRL